MTQRNLKDGKRPVFTKFSPPSITLAWGEIFAFNSTVATVIALAGVKAQVTNFDNNGLSNNMTPDHTNDHITIDVAGTHLINCSITADSVAGAGAKYSFNVYKNNGAIQLENIHAHRSLSGGGSETASVSLNGISSLNENDTIDCWVLNESNAQNIIIEDITLSITRLGGN